MDIQAGMAVLGAVARRPLEHIEDAAVLVLVWQLGSVALFNPVGGGTSRFVIAIPDRRRIRTSR